MRAKILFEVLSLASLLAVFVTQVEAACLTAQLINQFKLNPKTLIVADTDTEGLVKDLVGSDASLAAAVFHVAEATTPRFQTAIAAGLALAAIACTTVGQQAALLSQQAAASFPNGQFQASFVAVAGDLSTAVTAAATASAAGSAGSVTVTNPNISSGSTLLRGYARGANVPIRLTFATAATTSGTNSNWTKATTAADPVKSRPLGLRG
jgi:hypothetical protein